MNRREFLQASSLTASALAAGGCASMNSKSNLTGPAVKNGRIQQSVVFWCFNMNGEKWSLDQTCVIAKEMGCKSVELVGIEDLPTLKKHGLTCAITQINMNPDPPFLRGFNNPDNWERLIKVTKETIDAAAAYGSPSVICFTGYAAKDPSNPNSPVFSTEEGAKNCVEGFKKVIGYAEQKKVDLCIEMLNSRVANHPMKGHPGYQGDHIDYCIDIIKRVGSPRMKILFDIYHAQIMDGDIITRIHQHKDYIGHVHTAGNPGRGELDMKQEINYPATMQALLDVGYKGYVGQEFIPTRDPRQGLREAIALCDV